MPRKIIALVSLLVTGVLFFTADSLFSPGASVAEGSSPSTETFAGSSPPAASRPSGRTPVSAGTGGQPSGSRIFPRATKGMWEEMWGGFRRAGALCVPAFGLDSLDDSLEKKGPGAVKAADFEREYLYVQQRMQQGTMSFLAVYTDPALMKSGTPYETHRPIDFLRSVLFEHESDGIYFNPKSRVCDDHRFAYGTNWFGIAELIGYLEAAPEQGDLPYHELALRAHRNEKPFQVLFWWGLSYRQARPGDDWKKAELAKLRAYHQLDFPGSRERAVGELNWFLENHERTPEAEALLAEWRTPPVSR